MTLSEKWILMAVIGKAQGVTGQMRLKFFGETAESLAQYKCFYDKNGVEYPVKALHIHNGLPVVALAGVECRLDAERMAGLELFVRRGQLPDNLQEDEFYQEDLLGFAVFDETGGFIGHVSGFFNFGGGDLLELTMLPGVQADSVKRVAKKQKVKKELIPFSKAAVPSIEAAARQLMVNRQAAGLMPYAGEEDRPRNIKPE